MAIFPSSAIPAGATGYDIDNSLRFNDDDSAYLNRTFGTPTDGKKWTWSGWVKRGSNIGSNDYLFATAVVGGEEGMIAFNVNDILRVELGGVNLHTSMKFRDLSAWYHIIVSVDTTIASPSGLNQRVKMYVNGVQVTDFGIESYPALNYSGTINANIAHQVGESIKYSGNHHDGYLAEVHFIDGTALDPTSFGETGDYGEWKPKKVSGLTYGTNGFYLDFKYNAVYGITDTSSTYDVFGGGSPIVAYTFNNTTDGMYSQLGTSGSYNATDTNVTFTTGQYGNSAEFADNSGNNNSSVIETGGISGLTDTISISFWVYPFSTAFDIRSAIIDSTNDNKIRLTTHESSDGIQWGEASTRCIVLTPVNQWSHVVATLDGTYGKLYLNGEFYSSGTFDDTYTSGHTFDYIGHSGNYLYNSDNSFRGRLDQMRIFDRELTTTEVGALYREKNIVSSSEFYSDASGNDNTFNPTNLVNADVVLDTPTNNFCTLNPIGKLQSSYSSGTISEGNLKVHLGSPDAENFCTMAVSTGKWYFESYTAVSSRSPFVALVDLETHKGGSGTRSFIGMSSGSTTIYDAGSENFGGTSPGTISSTDVLGLALDLDNGAVYVSVNGTWTNSGDPTSGSSKTGALVTSTHHTKLASGTGTWSAFYTDGSATDQGNIFNFGQDSSFAGNKTAQGNQDGGGIGDFFYEPPSGFLALCTKNLPDPAVIPSEHFNTVLYVGNKPSTQSITGVGFQPDFLWIKDRASANWHQLFDILRDSTKSLNSNTTSAEANESDQVQSLDSDGFSLGTSDSINGARNFVAWNWKANGTGASNTNGSITSTVSANVDAGFSIVKWSHGTGASTIGHGLSKTPEMIIQKVRSTSSNWSVFTETTGKDNKLLLHDTAASAASGDWDNTVPTSTLFTSWLAESVDLIAYCFHSVDGYSKVGSYTGNYSTDGTFVYTGFRPAYVMIKRTNATYGWMINDVEREPYNAMNNVIQANLSSAEAASDYLDFTSNGFKLRTTGNSYNGSGGNYIYLAFAEHPFKHTNAR